MSTQSTSDPFLLNLCQSSSNIGIQHWFVLSVGAGAGKVVKGAGQGIGQILGGGKCNPNNRCRAAIETEKRTHTWTEIQ